MLMMHAFRDLGSRNLCTENLFSDMTDFLKVVEPLEISITKLGNEKKNLYRVSHFKRTKSSESTELI